MIERGNLINRIKRGLERVPDPPCIGCTWIRYCRTNEVACYNFRAYVCEPLGESYLKNRERGTNAPWPPQAEKPSLILGEAVNV